MHRKKNKSKILAHTGGAGKTGKINAGGN